MAAAERAAEAGSDGVQVSDEEYFSGQQDPNLRADQIIHRMDEIHELVEEHLKLTRVLVVLGLILIALVFVGLAIFIVVRL